VEIAVSGGGSGTGIKALLSGSAEIADASRPIKDQERKAAEAAGIHPTEHIVAYDGLAVIVHPSNPVTELSVEQLSDIFVGKIRQWREVGGTGGDIVLINRDSSSGTWEAFKNLVVTLNGTAKDRDYAPEALAAPSNQAVLDLVASTKAAIGYVGLSYLNERVKALWITPVGGGAPVPPTVANVQNRSYPISRALYCYTNGEPIGKLGEYIQWIKGPEGQAIVEHSITDCLLLYPKIDVSRQL